MSDLDVAAAAELLAAAGEILKKRREVLTAENASTPEIARVLLAVSAAARIISDDLNELLLETAMRAGRAHGLKVDPAALLHAAFEEAREQVETGLPAWRKP